MNFHNLRKKIQLDFQFADRLNWKEFWKEMLIIILCSFLSMGSITFLSLHFQIPLFVASFGASYVLLFAVPQSAFSQPKNLIGGYFFSALVGVTCYQLGGETWYMMSLAAALSIIIMIVTQTIHPPGGATALICVSQHCSYSFILAPVLAGSLILMLVFYLNKALRKKFLTESVV